MGIYKVRSNGSAPEGLDIGDLVVTGGGTYMITGFYQDGSYQSQPVDPNQTTYNYTGRYDSVGISKDNAEESYYDLLNQTVNNSYHSALGGQSSSSSSGGSLSQAIEEVQKNSMSFADAMALADKILSPQYTEAYRQSAENAAQRLEQAGLYDSVYGQALAAEAERDVTDQLNGAIGQLALELTKASAEDTRNILELLVKENQFGAEYDAEQKTNTLNYLLQMLKLKDQGA